MNWTIRHALATGLMAVAVLSNGCSDSVSIPELEGLDSVDELTQRRDIAQQRETLGIAKSKYLQLQQEGQRTRAALEELQGLHERWNTEVEALLKDEVGRQIAADEQDVITFRSHFDTLEKIPDAAIDSMHTELQALLSPVESAINESAVADFPDERLAGQISDLNERIQIALAPYRRATTAIDSLAANAKKRGEIGTQTLQDAVGTLVKAEAESRSAQIEAARKLADEDVTKLLAKAAQDLVYAKGEQERKTMQAEVELITAQTELEALKAKATNPDTMKRLEPFTSKATVALLSDYKDFCVWSPGQISAEPLSFAAISTFGALDPTEEGLRRLQNIASATESSRPKWPTANTSDDWAWVKENQSLLRELGTTLIQLGHLKP